MNFDASDEITSFSSKNMPKGLLTFYEEQWNTNTQKQQDYINNLISNKNIKRTDKKCPVLNERFSIDKKQNRYSFKLTEEKEKEKIQIIQKYQRKIICNNFRCHQMNKTQKKQTSQDQKIKLKEKQTFKRQDKLINNVEKISANKQFHKQILKYPQIHKRSIINNKFQKQNIEFINKKKLKKKLTKYSYQMIKIRNYPFQQEATQKNQLCCDNARQLNKSASLKDANLISSKFLSQNRLKNASKSFHLDSVILNEIKQDKKQYQASSKNFKKTRIYLFPIFCQQMTDNDVKYEKNKEKTQDQINYSQIISKFKNRQYRNTDLTRKYLDNDVQKRLKQK